MYDWNLDILKNKTDESHALKASELLEMIQNEGLKCDRKTLYDDIKSLEQAGVPAVIVGKALYEGRVRLEDLDYGR